MLRFSKDKKSLELIDQSSLKINGIMERSDLQQAIVNSWDSFCKEIMCDLYLVGQEVKCHDSVQDSIDILAYDSVKEARVIIELKREKNKLQLLQAISYAAMISEWSSDRILEEAQRTSGQDSIEDFKNDFSEIETNGKSVRIILIAEEFDPEVMLTAKWLSEQYEMDIVAYGIEIFKNGEELTMCMIKRFPLLELADVYEPRRSRKTKAATEGDLKSWDDVSEKLTYPWGRKVIDLCMKSNPGEPSRQRFRKVGKNIDGFSWVSINMRRKYINVYIGGKPDNAEQLLRSKFKEHIEVLRWEGGYSLRVQTESQSEDLIINQARK